MTISEITVDDLADLLDERPELVRLYDVREVHEYTDGHVAGAELIPLRSVPDLVDRFRGDATAYVICKTGARSMRACEYLVEQGIDAINIAGGTLGWIRSGRDIVTGDQPS